MFDMSEACAAWEAESSVLRMLCHKGIVKLYQAFEDFVFGYLVEELCEGVNLHQRLKSSGPIGFSEFVETAKEILDALEYCHAHGVAHLDLKPANILLTGTGQVRLADFGCSRLGADFFGGSEPYMSPEIIARVPRFDKFRSDIWSLGVMFCVMATGTLPWGKRTGEELRKAIGLACYERGGLGKRVASIVAKMLRAEPAARATIQEIREQIELMAKPPVPRKVHIGTSLSFSGLFLARLAHEKAKPGDNVAMTFREPSEARSEDDASAGDPSMV
jgi:serine/threonine protein kinase